MSTMKTVNGQTVVHKDSGGIVTTYPDVCMTPVGPTIAPVPYVNVARSSDTTNGSKTVTVDGNPIMLKDSYFSTSSGDEPGSAGGVSSGVIKGKAKFVNYSFDVFVEGRPVCRRLDPMVSNLSGSGNTPPAALMQENVESGVTMTGGHVLSFALVFKHPDVITGRITQPLVETGFVLDGPERHEVEMGAPLVGVVQEVATPGTYSVKFSDLNRSEMPLRPEK